MKRNETSTSSVELTFFSRGMEKKANEMRFSQGKRIQRIYDWIQFLSKQKPYERVIFF